MSTTTTTIIAIIAGAVFLVSIIRLFTKIEKSNYTKFTFTSKEGEIIEIDLDRKNDAKTILQLTDALLGH